MDAVAPLGVTLIFCVDGNSQWTPGPPPLTAAVATSLSIAAATAT